ncbi:MAG: ABC transporter substrate-binding protein [Caldilineaceae bacterium]
MVLTACAVPTAPAAAPAAEAPAAEGDAAAGSWWATAAAAAGCTDVTLRGVSESTPASNFARDVLAPAFAEASGINVELETTSWDQMYSKAIQDMEAGTGIYDFVYIEQDIVYAYLANNYLQNITAALAENPEIASPDFDVEKFTSFADFFKDAYGELYGVPMEAFIKINLYRKDLFEDPAVMAAFEEQYGRPLAPATNFDEYRENAEFFTAWGEENDMELWGTTVQQATGHSSSFYELVESIMPSAGVYNWGINMDSFKASVENGGEMNSDRAKEAFQFWVDMQQFAPPEATSSTWDEVAASFAAGRAAQGWVYGENAAWIANDPERSQVVGMVGVALPPVYDAEVMAEAEADTGYIGYYDGGAFGLPVSSKNPLCALLWGQYIGQESLQADWAVNSSRIVMDSTYDDPKVQAIDATTDGYYTMMKDQGPLFGGAPPFPFHAQVRAVVEPFVWQAISGEITVSDALDQAAAAADAELVNLGYAE